MPVNRDALDALRQEMEQLTLANQSIIDAADADGRDLTDAEIKQLDENQVKFGALETNLDLRERVLAQRESLSTGNGRRTDSRVPAGGTDRQSRGEPINQGRDGRPAPTAYPQVRRGVDPKAGFEGFGNFLCAVKTASLNPHAADQRLRIMQDTTNTFANETVGSDGGFLVPPDFRNMLMERMLSDENLLARTDSIFTSSNSVTMPVDESTPWDETSGILAFWENEGGIKTQSKLDSLEQRTIRLNKLVALVPVSDELLEDAPAIEAYIRRKAPQKINYKVNRAIIAGTGNGQPLGILNAPGKVVTDNGGTPSGQIRFANIADMYGRMYGPYRSSAVWLVNPEVEAQLMKMWFHPDPSAALPASPIPVYLPANSLAGSPFATLLGRPVIPTQSANVLGAEGDIIFAALDQYLTLMKTGGIKTDVSIHVYFVQDLTAFRFVLRIGGQPWWATPIDPRTGSFTQSAFVTLEAR